MRLKILIHRATTTARSRQAVSPDTRPAVALLLAIIAIIVSATLAYTYLAAQGTSIRIAHNVRQQTAARYLAGTGMEMALAYLRQETDWRNQQVNGPWAMDAPFASGTYSIYAEDGIDLDGDGVVDGDGDLADDPTDLVTLTVVGRIGQSAHALRTVITPIPGNGRKVLMVVPDPASLSVTEKSYEKLIASWNWQVTLIDDHASPADMNDAIAAVEVVYLTRSVTTTAAPGAINWPIGVVNESGVMSVALGLSSSHEAVSLSSVNVVNTAHAATENFSTGNLAFTSSAGAASCPSGTLTGSTTVLAERPDGSWPAVIVVETGDELLGFGNNGLNAAYYILSSNPSALGDINFDANPSATGTVSNVNFASTGGAGWPGGPNDNFAVKFTGRITIPTSGTWRFYTNSDDGSRLWIDGAVVVNNDGLHGMTERYGDISLTAGDHAIEIRGFERGGGYGLIASWRGPQNSPSKEVIPTAAFSCGIAAAPRIHVPFGATSAELLTEAGESLFRSAMEWAAGPIGGAGLTASCFAVGCCPSVLNNINWSATPTTTETVAVINFPMTNDAGWAGGPTEYFAIRYEGFITIPQAGTWTFYTESDDGSDLSISGNLVVSNDGLHSMRLANGSVVLDAGTYPFQARVFERTGEFGMIVSWRGPGVPLTTLVPASAFSTGTGENGGAGWTYAVDWQP